MNINTDQAINHTLIHDNPQINLVSYSIIGNR